MKIALKRGFSWPGGNDRDRKGGREALGMGYCSIIVLDGSELKLAWSRETVHIFKKISQYFYYLCWIRAGNIWIYLDLICILLLLPNFMCIKRFLLLLSSNDVSVYIADNEDSFEFSPKAEFNQPCNRYWSGATALRLTVTKPKTCWNSEGFKWPLSHLMLRSHADFAICLS